MSLSVQIGIFQSVFLERLFPLSLYNSSLSFHQISIKSKEASISIFL
jgi:hypothetical protein